MKVFFLLSAAACVFAGAASATVPGAITYAVIGDVDPAGKVPVLNGVPGSGVSNIAVPIPLRVLLVGNPYVVTIGSQNLAFAGGCVTNYVLAGVVDGKPKTISSAATKPYACGKQTVWAWVFNTPAIPDYVGPATLTAYVHYAKTVVKLSVPLTIEK